MAGYEQDLVRGRWVHSHEEDTDDEMVFRPADRPFPPARGRSAFEFHPDGTYAETSPGPVDVPETSTGSWSLEGDQLVLTSEGDAPDQTLEITGAEADRLTIRK